MPDFSHIIIPDFDEESHEYRVDGDLKPGVSEILRGAGFGDPSETGSGYVIAGDVIENAAERGRHIHIAIELLDNDALDWESVSDELLPYVEAYAEWRESTGFVSALNEARFFEPDLDYCGTADKVGFVGDGLTVLDIKTGSAGLKPWHKYALAAYAAPFREEGEWPQRIVLHLKSNGKAKAHHFSPATAAWHMDVFRACRTIAVAKELDRPPR